PKSRCTPYRDDMFSYEIPVLHLVNRFWIGGAERQFVERLRRHPPGFRAIVGCLEASGPMLEQVRALGYEPHVFPLGGSMARPNSAIQIARIASLMRAEGVKIVHSNDLNTNLLGLAAAKIVGAKAVVSRVDLGHLRAGFTRWHRQAEKLCTRLADMVVANAEAGKALFLRQGRCRRDRVAVVRSGVDLERFAQLMGHPLQGPRPGGRLVAVIGTLWPVKGHRVLVEGVALLPKELETARFVCAGDGPEREPLTRR